MANIVQNGYHPARLRINEAQLFSLPLSYTDRKLDRVREGGPEECVYIIYIYCTVYVCTVYETERHERHGVERKDGRRECKEDRWMKG